MEFNQVLKHDLDKDSRGRSRIVFIHFNHFKSRPGQCVCPKQMTKESCDIAQSISLIAMNRIEISPKSLLKVFRPDLIQFRQAFTTETIEFRE